MKEIHEAIEENKNYIEVDLDTGGSNEYDEFSLYCDNSCIGIVENGLETLKSNGYKIIQRNEIIKDSGFLGFGAYIERIPLKSWQISWGTENIPKIKDFFYQSQI